MSMRFQNIPTGVKSADGVVVVCGIADDKDTSIMSHFKSIDWSGRWLWKNVVLGLSSILLACAGGDFASFIGS